MTATILFQGSAGDGTIEVRAGGDVMMTHRVEPTGMTVGEPRSEWVVESFESFRLGAIELYTPGYYEIEADITVERGSEVKLNWMWLEPE